MKLGWLLAVPVVLLSAFVIVGSVGCDGNHDDDSTAVTNVTTVVTNAPAAETLTGTWSGTWHSTPGGTSGGFHFTISQNGNVLTGGYSDAGGWHGNVNGTVNAGDLKAAFTINFAVPAGRVESWEGNIADAHMNAMSGTWAANDGNFGTWTASKD